MEDQFRISKITDIRLLNSGQIELNVEFKNTEGQKNLWMNLQEIDEYDEGPDLVNLYQQHLNNQLKRFPFFHGVEPQPPSQEQQKQRLKKQKKFSKDYEKTAVLTKTVFIQKIAKRDEDIMEEKSASEPQENLLQRQSPLPFNKLYQHSILGTHFSKTGKKRRTVMKRQRLSLASNVIEGAEGDQPHEVEENPHYEYDPEKEADRFLMGRYERIRINTLPSKVKSRRWKKIPLRNDLDVEPSTLAVLDINQRKGKKYCKVQADNQLYWMEKQIVQQKYLESLLRFYEKRISLLQQ